MPSLDLPRLKRLARRAALGLLAAAVALVALSAARASLYDVDRLAREAPRGTALMRARAAAAGRAGRAWHPRQTWVPYERISPLLRRAVLTAEDAAFYRHGGLDWTELKAAACRDLEERRVVRGGSTITQQLAKNLYLGDRRTLTRKLTEVFLALRMERALSKRRIFELYLNLIEWGDGIFGAEAAARHYYGKPASALSSMEAARLATVLPNPIRFNPLSDQKYVTFRANLIHSIMVRRGIAIEDFQEVMATPEGGAQDGAQPEGQKPEGPAPEGAKPEAAKPDGQTPEAQKPEGPKPEAQKPEGPARPGNKE